MIAKFKGLADLNAFEFVDIDSHVGTLSDLDGKFFREEAADIAFRMETEKKTNFLSMVWNLMVEQT